MHQLRRFLTPSNLMLGVPAVMLMALVLDLDAFQLLSAAGPAPALDDGSQLQRVASVAMNPSETSEPRPLSEDVILHGAPIGDALDQSQVNVAAQNVQHLNATRPVPTVSPPADSTSLSLGSTQPSLETELSELQWPGKVASTTSNVLPSGLSPSTPANAPPSDPQIQESFSAARVGPYAFLASSLSRRAPDVQSAGAYPAPALPQSPMPPVADSAQLPPGIAPPNVLAPPPMNNVGPPLRQPFTVAPLAGGRSQGPSFRPADAVAALPDTSSSVLRQQVDAHVASGFELASHRAYYSAKKEFETALRIIAQGSDMTGRSNVHTTKLARALQAIEEADEFLITDVRGEMSVDLTNTVVTHRTEVLKNRNVRGMSPLEAMQVYYGHAQQLLGAAVGEHRASSRVLYGLGKIYCALAGEPAQPHTQLAGPKAMLMYQTALRVDPRNQLAANELGVMLARYGQYVEAKNALLQSVAIRPMPETWHNLSIVHQHLGEFELAAKTRDLYRLALSQQQQQRRPLVVATDAQHKLQWIDVNEAVRQAAQSKTPTTTAPGQPPADRSASQQNSKWSWLPFGNVIR